MNEQKNITACNDFQIGLCILQKSILLLIIWLYFTIIHCTTYLFSSVQRLVSTWFSRSFCLRQVPFVLQHLKGSKGPLKCGIVVGGHLIFDIVTSIINIIVVWSRSSDKCAPQRLVIGTWIVHPIVVVARTWSVWAWTIVYSKVQD